MDGLPLPRLTESQMMAIRNVNFQNVNAKIQKDMSKAMDKLTGGVHDAIEDAGGFLGMVELTNPCDLLKEDLL